MFGDAVSVLENAPRLLRFAWRSATDISGTGLFVRGRRGRSIRMLVMDQPTRKVRKSENNQTPSHLQLAQVRHARPHLFQVHLHEVVFHATSFSGGENFLPVQRALTYSDNLSRVRIPALHVHGD